MEDVSDCVSTHTRKQIHRPVICYGGTEPHKIPELLTTLFYRMMWWRICLKKGQMTVEHAQQTG